MGIPAQFSDFPSSLSVTIGESHVEKANHNIKAAWIAESPHEGLLSWRVYTPIMDFA